MSSGVPICSIRPAFITITPVGNGQRLLLVVRDIERGDAPSSFCNSRNSTRIDTRSYASRLDSGSSNSSTSGENAIARATATRCC